MLDLIRLKYLKNIYPEYNRENIIKWKKAVYGLKIKEDFRNELWEYLNGDRDICAFSKKMLSLIMSELEKME